MAPAAAAAPASRTTEQDHNNKKPPEYNPRWKGYVYVALSSLVNFASISNIATVVEDQRRGSTVVSMSFGVFTFMLSVLVLVQDRSQRCLEPFHYTKALNGKVEGGVLLFCVLWWIGG